jgi:kynurenine formamidase
VRVVRIVDLSIVVDGDTQTYPGDPRPTIRQASTIEASGFNVLSLSIGSHTGTHVDAPFHILDSGARLEDVDLRLLAGPAVIADLTGHGSRQPILWDDLAPHADRLGPGVILALRTAWSDRYLGSDRYFDHPYLDVDACARLLDLGVRTLAVDCLNPDETIVDGEAGFPVHHLWLEAGGVIAENLTNLGAVDFEDPLLCLFPVRLGGDADGAPCRAVALQLAP